MDCPIEETIEELSKELKEKVSKSINELLSDSLYSTLKHCWTHNDELLEALRMLLPNEKINNCDDPIEIIDNVVRRRAGK